jgi:hypothetical protein
LTADGGVWQGVSSQSMRETNDNRWWFDGCAVIKDEMLSCGQDLWILLRWLITDIDVHRNARCQWYGEVQSSPVQYYCTHALYKPWVYFWKGWESRALSLVYDYLKISSSFDKIQSNPNLCGSSLLQHHNTTRRWNYRFYKKHAKNLSLMLHTNIMTLWLLVKYWAFHQPSTIN